MMRTFRPPNGTPIIISHRIALGRIQGSSGTCLRHRRPKALLLINEPGLGWSNAYQKLLRSYWTKMLQRLRNILEVTARRCYRVSGTSWKLTSWQVLEEVVTTYQKDVGSHWRRCFHVSEKSWNLMEEDVTTYQEHRDIFWHKLFQRIRKMLEVNEEGVTTYQKDLGR